MITGISVGFKNAILQLYSDFVDVGPIQSKVLIYEEPAPVPGEPIGGQKLLAVVFMPRPFTDTIEDGVLISNSFEPVMAIAGGFAGWCRVLDGNGDWLHDGDVSDDMGNGFFRLQGGTNIIAGGIVIVSGCTITI